MVDNRAENAAAETLPRHLGEEVLHRIEPGRRGRDEVEGPARMARQPGQYLGMLVGSVVVEDDVDRLVGGNLRLDSVEKADEFTPGGRLEGWTIPSFAVFRCSCRKLSASET
jgi:hypothetical protein